MLDHADFYRAAAADCGCHDNRMDKVWWNELWMSYPVDDSYAANEKGVLDALEHFNRFDHEHKIIVMTPLIELGSDSKEVHERLGEELAKANANIFITGTAYREDILRGFTKHSNESALQFIPRPKQLAEEVSAAIKPNTAILLEGRIPSNVRQTILHPPS